MIWTFFSEPFQTVGARDAKIKATNEYLAELNEEPYWAEKGIHWEFKATPGEKIRGRQRLGRRRIVITFND